MPDTDSANATMQVLSWGLLIVIQWCAAFLFLLDEKNRKARYVSLLTGFLAIMLAPALAYRGFFADPEWSAKFLVVAIVAVMEFIAVNEYGLVRSELPSG